MVSCSSNGNSTAGVDEQTEWMLIPRYADRLEAIGEIGLVRTWQYTLHKKRPLFLDSTPRPKTRAEVKEVATTERFDGYQNGVKSVSMMDHFYDKLLHLGVEGAIPLRNSYIAEEARHRHEVMVEFVVQFGTSGEVNEQYLSELERKLCHQ